MKRVCVSSSSIASIGYDPGLQILEVEFAGGGVYQYSNVPQDIFEEFQNADSMGNYMNHNIKDRYPYSRVLE